MKMEELIKVSKAAKFLNCHPETVRRWERKGFLKAQRDYLGHRVFKVSDLIAARNKAEKLKCI